MAASDAGKPIAVVRSWNRRRAGDPGPGPKSTSSSAVVASGTMGTSWRKDEIDWLPEGARLACLTDGVGDAMDAVISDENED
jgi:hypothetical protein